MFCELLQWFEETVCLCPSVCRHEVFANQFRAMFVLNCKIVKDEQLTYRPKPDKKARKRQRQRGQTEGERGEGGEMELYHPVRCNFCNTEVAVYDRDEVFHFFNVLSSAP